MVKAKAANANRSGDANQRRQWSASGIGRLALSSGLRLGVARCICHLVWQHCVLHVRACRWPHGRLYSECYTVFLIRSGSIADALFVQASDFYACIALRRHVKSWASLEWNQQIIVHRFALCGHVQCVV